MHLKRGDIFYADLSPVVGSEQGGVRPVVVLQNNVGNRISPTTIVAPLTTQNKPNLPTHYHTFLLGRRNTLLLEHLRTISRTRLREYVGSLSEEALVNISTPLKAAFNIDACMVYGASAFQPIKRGDLFFADLGPTIGSEQSGFQQVVVLQNDLGNLYSPTILVAAVTRQAKRHFPTHVPITTRRGSGIVLLEQLRSVSSSRLTTPVGRLNTATLGRIEAGLKLSLDIDGVMTQYLTRQAAASLQFAKQ